MRISDWSSDVCSSDLVQRSNSKFHPQTGTTTFVHTGVNQACKQTWVYCSFAWNSTYCTRNLHLFLILYKFQVLNLYWKSSWSFYYNMVAIKIAKGYSRFLCHLVIIPSLTLRYLNTVPEHLVLMLQPGYIILNYPQRYYHLTTYLLIEIKFFSIV